MRCLLYYRRFLVVCVFLLVGGFTQAQAQNSDYEFDQTKTVQIRQSIPPSEVLANSWKQFQQKFASEGLLEAMLYSFVPNDISLGANIKEYRDTGGGPMSSLMGIQVFSLQNALVKVFMGLLLGIFLGAAVITGLNGVATGGGSINYITLAFKLLLGIIVVFAPDFVYGVGRTIQLSGVMTTRFAISQLSSNAQFEQLKERSKDTDWVEQQFAFIIHEAQKEALSSISPAVAEEPVKSIGNYINYVEKTDGAQGNPDFDLGENPQEDQLSSITKALRQSLPLIALNEQYGEQIVDFRQAARDSLAQTGDFQAVVEKLRKDVVKTSTEELTTVFHGKPGFFEWLTSLALDPMAAAADLVIGGVQKVARGTVDAIAAVITPLALWVLMVFSSIVLEFTVMIVVLTYPLYFLDGTKKAFLGAVNTLFSTAIIPSVGFVLFFIFQCFAALIMSILLPVGAAGLFIPGVGITVLVIAFAVFYIVGMIMILWKTPKISKAILEGGSFIGTMMGTMLASVISGALAGVGVAAIQGTLPGMKALAGQAGQAAEALPGPASGSGASNPTANGAPTLNGNQTANGASGTPGNPTSAAPVKAQGPGNRSNLLQEDAEQPGSNGAEPEHAVDSKLNKKRLAGVQQKLGKAGRLNSAASSAMDTTAGIISGGSDGGIEGEGPGQDPQESGAPKAGSSKQGGNPAFALNRGKSGGIGLRPTAGVNVLKEAKQASQVAKAEGGSALVGGLKGAAKGVVHNVKSGASNLASLVPGVGGEEGKAYRGQIKAIVSRQAGGAIISGGDLQKQAAFMAAADLKQSLRNLEPPPGERAKKLVS